VNGVCRTEIHVVEICIVVVVSGVNLQSMKSDDLRERLEESEKLMNEMEKTWEDKLKETERIHMVMYLFCHNICSFQQRNGSIT